MIIDTSQKKSNRQTWLSLGLTALLILLLVLFVTEELEVVRSFIRGSGWIGMLVSVILYGVLGFSPIPSEPLTVMLSTIYGPLAATLVAAAGNTLAAVMEYTVGEHLGVVTVFEQRKASLPFGLGRLPVNSAAFLLAARMIPGYGPKLVSLVSGIYRVPMGRYLWTAIIPNLLGAAIFAFGGFHLIQQFVDLHVLNINP